MILSEVKNHLRAGMVTSLFDMSKRFNVEPNVMRDMLEVLIRKGQVRRCTKTPRCGTQCSKCSVLLTEIYEWVDVGIVKNN